MTVAYYVEEMAEIIKVQQAQITQLGDRLTILESDIFQKVLAKTVVVA